MRNNLIVDVHCHSEQLLYPNTTPEDVGDLMRKSGLAITVQNIVPDGCLLHFENGKVVMEEPKNEHQIVDYTDKAFENLKWTINESDLQFIKSSSDILQISIVGKRGIIVGIEGADHLQKDLRQLAFDYQYRHLRQLGLVHYYPSELADNQTEPEKYGGLSTFGLSAVKLCNNLGIIIDLAHLSEKSMNDVLKETSAPVVCSHTSIREAGDDDARKLPSEIALKIANQGGLIGIWPNSILFPSIMDYAIGLKKAADLVGVNNIAIGTDRCGLQSNLFSDYTAFSELQNTLMHCGFTEKETDGILGLNYFRVFSEVENLKLQ